MRTRHINDSDPRRDQRGFTLVEAAVSAILFTGMLAVTFTTMLSVSTAREGSEAEFKQEGTYREVLEAMCAELSQSTFENNPVTNQPRVAIQTNATVPQLKSLEGVHRKKRIRTPTGGVKVAGTNPNHSLTFQMIEGATQNGNEVAPRWSSDITYTLNARGQIVREQDGERRVLASGIKDLSFERTASDRFRVTLTAHWKDPKSGQIQEISHSKIVRPWN